MILCAAQDTQLQMSARIAGVANDVLNLRSQMNDKLVDTPVDSETESEKFYESESQTLAADSAPVEEHSNDDVERENESFIVDDSSSWSEVEWYTPPRIRKQEIAKRSRSEFEEADSQSVEVVLPQSKRQKLN